MGRHFTLISLLTSTDVLGWHSVFTFFVLFPLLLLFLSWKPAGTV